MEFIQNNNKINERKFEIKLINQKEDTFEFFDDEKRKQLSGTPLLIKEKLAKKDFIYKIIGINFGKNKDTGNYKGILLKYIINLIFENKNVKIKNIKFDKPEKTKEKLDEKNIIYEEIKEDFIDEIELKYKIKEEKNIRIFGDEFISFNKDICKIIINSKEEELCDYYDTENIKLGEDNVFTIRLKGISKVTNINSIFSFCDTLISISSLDININKIIGINNLFCGCESLDKIPDISKWDIKNITDISGMFSGCLSLKSLPDISKWNTSNLRDISNLFSECSSLESLPDISNWDTSQVTNMNSLFKKNSSLLSILRI